MTATTESLIRNVLALPPAERDELLDAILSADDSEGIPLTPEWRAEVGRRSAEIDAGTVALAPWEEVRKRVHDRFGGLDNG